MAGTPAPRRARVVENNPFLDTKNSFKEGATLADSVVDAGNSPTTQLRAGLVVGKNIATGLWHEASDAAADSGQFGILRDPVLSMLAIDNATERQNVTIYTANIIANSNKLQDLTAGAQTALEAAGMIFKAL